MMLCRLFFIFFLIFWNCSSAFLRERPGTLEYWKLSEKVFLDYYGSDEQKEHAFATLKKRCNLDDVSEAISCYNLSVLYFYSKEYEKSYEFAKKAVEKESNDELFLDMLRQSAIESGKIDLLKKDYPHQNEIVISITKLSDSCRKKDEKSAISELEFLISKNSIPKEFLQTSEITECISKEKLKLISHDVQNSKINYKRYLLEEKKKSYEFSSIWDTTNFFEKKKNETTEPPKKLITKYWMDFKKNVQSNNIVFAKENLKQFFNEIKIGLENDKKNRHLYNSMDRAARLLIERDKFFEKFKNLPKEL